MTKNNAQKKAARLHQAANRGTPFPSAMRAVDTRLPAAVPGTPWFRERKRRLVCYCCGHPNLIASFGDEREDTARFELYCENSGCDAREIAVIALSGNMIGTSSRADVRTLTHFPQSATSHRTVNGRYDDWLAGSEPWVRTQRGEDFPCLWCGEMDSRLSQNDVATDRSRFHLRCLNTSCVVREYAVLIVRDGTLGTADRPDVMAIQYIDTPPSSRRTPGDASYDFVAMQRVLDEDDKLARRRSTGPIDWSAATRIR
ncbi:hypothetical protein CH306_02520 [Rhodococcus sp. 15-725-2-2b]|nr:hypothetical protein CH277_00795 [Rhodococcus sp. 06-469-3-2]OZE77575.1 hypothetical protein CH306_02520 [Rhodococcus sp. 15-725-2-2b]